MKRFILIGLIIIVASTSHFLSAQTFQATATLDKDTILIGDQIHVNFTLTAPQGSNFTVSPITEEELSLIGIDLLNSSSGQTNSGQNVIYKQQWTITIFDIGAYVFPAIQVLSPDSQLLAQSQALLITVNSMGVDPNLEIQDINPIIEEDEEESSPSKKKTTYLIIALAAAAVIALLVWLYLRYRRKNKSQNGISKAKTKEKPHITALKALEELKLKKLWQNGLVKQYYSELTDILRTYIDGRYNINAMEMISADIIDELDEIGLPQHLKQELEQTLNTADLVKFAKMEPLPDEHDRCFKQAVNFVQETADQESGARGQESGAR